MKIKSCHKPQFELKFLSGIFIQSGRFALGKGSPKKTAYALAA
jgi:hypothetical protein